MPHNAQIFNQTAGEEKRANKPFCFFCSCIHFGVLPTSRAQTELKGSEYAPHDAIEPTRTAGGG